MSKTFPYQDQLDQIPRAKLRQPQKVNRRALQAIAELQLENHQELELDETSQFNLVNQEIVDESDTQDSPVSIDQTNDGLTEYNWWAEYSDYLPEDCEDWHSTRLTNTADKCPPLFFFRQFYIRWVT